MTAKLRVWAFRMYWKKCYATEHDPLLRFAKALLASLRPIRNSEMARRWYDHHVERTRRRK